MTNQTADELKAIGMYLFREGLYDESLGYFKQAQEQFAADGNDAGVGEMLNNQGVVYWMLRSWDEGWTTLGKAREIFIRIGDRHREAQVLGNMGGLLASRGNSLQAQEYLRRAANIFAELGDNQRQGETLLVLGMQMWKSGNRWDGLAAYKAGLEMLEHPTLQHKIIRGLLRLLEHLLWIQIPRGG